MDDNIENPDQEPAPVQPEPQDAASSEETQDIPQDSRTLCMLCHLLGLLANFLGPLILWLIKKDEDKFVDRHGKEALNFQITVAIAFFVSALLSSVCIGFVLMPAVAIADLVFCIMACVKVNQGQDYRYPLTFRFVK